MLNTLPSVDEIHVMGEDAQASLVRVMALPLHDAAAMDDEVNGFRRAALEQAIARVKTVARSADTGKHERLIADMRLAELNDLLAMCDQIRQVAARSVARPVRPDAARLQVVVDRENNGAQQVSLFDRSRPSGLRGWWSGEQTFCVESFRMADLRALRAMTNGHALWRGAHGVDIRMEDVLRLARSDESARLAEWILDSVSVIRALDRLRPVHERHICDYYQAWCSMAAAQRGRLSELDRVTCDHLADRLLALIPRKA